MGNNTIKADLRIRLYAGDMLVAEADDPGLWQRVLATITTSESPHDDRDKSAPLNVSGTGGESDAFTRFAKELKLPNQTVQGALAPSTDPPFLHLDARTWEAFKKNFPARGTKAVAAPVFALTALALWFQSMATSPPTTAQAQAVLRTINVRGSNPTRSITNCEWLQQRGENVILNPAEISKAVKVVRAYCTKQPLAENG